MPDRPFRDEVARHRRSTLSHFCVGVAFSALAVVLAKKLATFRSLLLSAAFTWLAILFLLRFLPSNDEREQQINYRALTFAFNGTLVFSALVGFLQMFGFHPEHCLASRRL